MDSTRSALAIIWNGLWAGALLSLTFGENALDRRARCPDLLRGLSLQPLDRDQRGHIHDASWRGGDWGNKFTAMSVYLSSF